MKSRYPHLLSPLEIRGFVLKNRLESSSSYPHFLQGPEQYPAPGTVTHFANRAKAGAAIVSTTCVRSGSANNTFNTQLDFAHFPDYNIYDGECQNYLLHMADTIHYHGSIPNMCLMWGPPAAYELMVYEEKHEIKAGANGIMGDPSKSFDLPEADSYHLEKIPSHLRPNDYSVEQLEKIAEAYAQQAKIVRGLDYEMLDLHFAYRLNLPAKMFSPLANNRTDSFNGSLENRMRFPLMVLRRVREAVGEHTILEIEWSFDDLPGGYTIDETCAFLNEAKQYIDVVQLKANDGVPAHPTSFTLEHEPFLKQAAYVKAHVPGLVIASVAGYFDPDVMEEAIATGKLDLIAQARAWISNPDYGHMLMEGKADDLVPCLRCNKCHGRGPDDPFESVCSVNPTLGMEHELTHLIRPVTRSKKVAVIGGGPGGMRCAIYLADRGHTVTLYEADSALGGAIRHADYAPFKWTLKQFKEYLIAQVEKRPSITVLLNTRATPEQVEAAGYNVVVAAVGGVPAVPPIPGLKDVKAWYSAEAFGAAQRMGDNVVVIGGGEVGVEAGIQIAQKGHHVTVLEMRPMLAADATKIHYREELDLTWENEPNFTGITRARVTAVTQNSVTYVDADGAEHTLPADDIVVSAGMKAQVPLAQSFYGTAPEFYMLGDCKKPGTIQTTMRQAFAVAHNI